MPQLRHWQIRMFYATFIGYAVFYICRKNISAALPAMGSELHLSNMQLGLIGTSLYWSYAIGKFVNGVLGDRLNVRLFMSVGLLATSVVNLFFGMTNELYVLAILWGLNGWFQSMGWPPCAKVLTHWYGRKRRGTIWGLWSTSHQAGSALILALGAWLTQHHGWQSAFLVPGAIGVIVSFFLFNRLRDRPEEVGLPAIETSPSIETSYRNVFVRDILKNPLIWLLSIQNAFVYIVRYGTLDWSVKFLVEEKGSNIATAGSKVAISLLSGIVGTIAAGYLADRFFKKNPNQLNFYYMILLGVSVYLFWMIPGSSLYLQLAALSAIGFLVYGPQMLVGGLCTAEVVDKKAVSAATGLVGLFGYFGAGLSGIGSGKIVDLYGWQGGFIFWSICAFAGALISLAMWKTESR